MINLLPLGLAVFLATLGYGVTFPLLAIRLEATGVSGLLIGVNAAMPALGWIIGSALIPRLQIRQGISIVWLARGFLLIAALSLAALRFADGYGSMTALRFAFGGSMGLFLRSVEFWINGSAADEQRGRTLGLYSILFMVAIMLGAALQPALGTSGWPAFAPPIALIAAAALVLLVWRGVKPPHVDLAVPAPTLSLVVAVPAAFLAVLAYGMFESIPVSLIEVYALKNGLGETTAALTLSAAALGNILMQYPVGALSDRVGRLLPLLTCALVVIASSLAMPYVMSDQSLFLALVGVWGGAAGTVYSLALAMVGDHYDGARLVVANAAFGIVYAIGSLVGPLTNGAALDTYETHGVMFAAAAIFAALVALVGASQAIRRPGVSQ